MVEPNNLIEEETHKHKPRQTYFSARASPPRLCNLVKVDIAADDSNAKKGGISNETWCLVLFRGAKQYVNMALHNPYVTILNHHKNIVRGNLLELDILK